MTTRITTGVLEPTIGQAVADLAAGNIPAKAQVFATLQDLPGSGNLEGDFAYVSAIKSLFVWDGTSWTRAYVGVNEAPVITSQEIPSSVAIDFTSSSIVNHTIPFTAEDPEGFPITYSHQLVEPLSGMVQSVTRDSAGFNLVLSTNNSVNLGNTAVFRAIASDGIRVSMRTQSLLFIAAAPISLSGGTNTSTLYTAPNGTTVTTTDANYSSGSSYFIAYMVNGSFPTTNTLPGTTDYWLSNSAATGSVTFNFSSSPITYIHQVTIYPRTRTDTVTSIVNIQTSTDGMVWTDVNNSTIPVTGSTPANQAFVVDIRRQTKYVRLNLSKSGAWGLSLAEVLFTGF